MKKVAAIDLETIANKNIIDFLPEPKPNGKMTNPITILADKEKKFFKQIADMGMEPMHNMICCAGWADKDGTYSIMLKEETEEAEKELLEKFWEVLCKYDHFVTFNGRSFDLRCMLLHGMKYGVRAGIKIDGGRYNRGNHTDLRPVLAGDGQFAKGKLDYFAKVFGVGQKVEGMTGDQVQAYWDNKRYEEISTYCKQDCKLTLDLYYMAELAGLLE